MKVSVHLAPFFLFVFFMSLILGSSFVFSAEHPGKSTVEHPGKAITADSVKKSIEQHVTAQAKSNNGVFMVEDPKLNKGWRLKLAKVHDPVRTFEKDGMTIYFACSDFDSVDSDEPARRDDCAGRGPSAGQAPSVPEACHPEPRTFSNPLPWLPL